MPQPETSTVGDILEYNALHFPDATALRAMNRTLSNGQWVRRARQLGSAFEKAGLDRQDRVSILSRNSLEFMEVYGACWIGGLITATVNFRLAAPEIAYIVKDAAPRIFIFEAAFLPQVEAIRDQLKTVERFICIGGRSDWADEFENFLTSGDVSGPTYTARGEDIACLIYTSGTTGRPKGCVIGQRELARLARTLALVQPTPIFDRFLAVMPLFHIGGMATSLAHLSGNGAVHILREFDAKEVLAAISEERIGILLLAPTMVQMLLDAPQINEADLSSLHTIIYSASPMPSNTLRRGIEMFGKVFVQYYGQTEVISTYLPRELHLIDGADDERARLLSAGIPFADANVRIVDEHGKDCPEGKTGEIMSRTPAMARGYWNAEAATKETFQDGWCRTGDIGRLDERGFVYIVDRKKDVIISGGENIYSREVEEALLQHSAVAEAAVIGRPDPVWGEAVCAVVRLSEGRQASEAELIEFVKSQIASYKKPKAIMFVGELPKLVSGKINKIALREMFGATAAVNGQK